MAEIEFLDIKIGDGLRLNGYPMGLLAVGNLLVADHQRIEIVILQRLEDEQPPRDYLVELLRESGFPNGVLQDIITAAIGHMPRNTDDLTDDEVVTAILAVESAIVDREQLQGEKE